MYIYTCKYIYIYIILHVDTQFSTPKPPTLDQVFPCPFDSQLVVSQPHNSKLKRLLISRMRPDLSSFNRRCSLADTAIKVGLI